jgi:tetratricopeptide (TPR) repeat protein
VALWLLGYPEQALRKSHEALTLAQELFHPNSLAFALNVAACLHQYRWEGQAAQKRAEAAITLSTEQGFPFFLAWGTMLRGWTLAEQGQGEEGIAQIREGLAAFRDIESEVLQPYFLALLAEMHGKVGQAEEGLRVVDEALAFVERTEERFCEAELYRLTGELLLMQATANQFRVGAGLKPAGIEEAEKCFHQAIEVARRQSAKSLELRAAMSLSRLRQKQDKKEEARQLLVEIYGWFTEGFDTKDLQEAKVLLETLSWAGKRADSPPTLPVFAQKNQAFPLSPGQRAARLHLYHVYWKSQVRASALSVLTAAIQQHWPASPEAKVKCYVDKFFERIRVGKKLLAKIQGNHGVDTVSLEAKKHHLQAACSCYIGGEGYCHHCHALGLTFLQDVASFTAAKQKRVRDVRTLADLRSALKGVRLESSLQDLRTHSITQKAFAESIGMNPRHLAAIKSSELRNRYFSERGATKLAALWVLEHCKPLV